MWGAIVSALPTVIHAVGALFGRGGERPYAEWDKRGHCKMCFIKRERVQANGGCGVKKCPLERIEDPTPEGDTE